MNRKALIAISCAVIAGILAVVLVNQYITRKEESIFKGMEMVEVLVMGEDTKASTKISKGILAKRSMPKKYVHGNAISLDEVDLVDGQTLNFPLKKGDPLLWTDLGEEGAKIRLKGLAGTITKGERAVSIAVDKVGGVSGLLKPNDHIDLLFTARSRETGEEATITLLQNITVLATGLTLSGESSTRGNYSTVTLLVTLEEAELLVFAQEKGNLVAVLRNPEDIDTLDDIPKVDFSNIMKTEYRQQIQKTRNSIEVIKKGKTTQK